MSKSINQCNTCFRASDDLRCCSKCKYAYYCNRDCQLLNWKSHKLLCERTGSEFKFVKDIVDSDSKFYITVCLIADSLARHHNERLINVVLTLDGETTVAKLINISMKTQCDNDETGLLRGTFASTGKLEHYDPVIEILWTHGIATYGKCCEVMGRLEEDEEEMLVSSECISVSLNNGEVKVTY